MTDRIPDDDSKKPDDFEDNGSDGSKGAPEEFRVVDPADLIAPLEDFDEDEPVDLLTPGGQYRYAVLRQRGFGFWLRDPTRTRLLIAPPPVSEAERREIDRFLGPERELGARTDWWRLAPLERERLMQTAAENLRPRRCPLPAKRVLWTCKEQGPREPLTAVQKAAEDREVEAFLEHERQAQERQDREDAAAFATSERIDPVDRRWAECVPLAGSLGETYLTGTRGIPVPAQGWPDAIRWHARDRAVVFALTTAGGERSALHNVYVTPQATNVLGAADHKGRRRKKKLTFGIMADGWVRLPATTPSASPGPLQLAEGGETGLTAWRATGHETWISCGVLARFKPPRGRRLVLLCRDDDRAPRQGEAVFPGHRAYRAAGPGIAVSDGASAARGVRQASDGPEAREAARPSEAADRRQAQPRHHPSGIRRGI